MGRWFGKKPPPPEETNKNEPSEVDTLITVLQERERKRAAKVRDLWAIVNGEKRYFKLDCEQSDDKVVCESEEDGSVA